MRLNDVKQQTAGAAGYLADCHLHSRFSPDSTATLEEICAGALARGLSEITVTDHVEILPGQAAAHRLTQSALAVEWAARQYKGRLLVRLGVELGQPQDNPAEARRVCESCALDFVIGSIHVMADGNDPYDCDFTALDMAQYYAGYLERLIEMARVSDFDVAGHLTYPLRYMYIQLGRAVELAPFTERFRELFGLLRERGRGIEINTSGYRQPIGEPYPPAQLLRLYRECGGELVSIGSDAHAANDVGQGVREAASLLRELGFRYYMTFANRKPNAHPL